MWVPNNWFQFLELLCFSWHFRKSTLPHSHYFFLSFFRGKKTWFQLIHLSFVIPLVRPLLRFYKEHKEVNLGILIRLKAIHSIFCMLSAFVTFYLIEFTIYISMNLLGCCENFKKMKCLGFLSRTSPQTEPNIAPFGSIRLRFH